MLKKSVVTILAIYLFTLSLPATANSMDTWFRDFKKDASPSQLYAFLWALPKGGDIHHHLSGAGFSEWWFELATSPELNGHYTYFTRVKFNQCHGYGNNQFGGSPAYLMFRTVQKSNWEALSACEKDEYLPLTALSETQKSAFLDSLRLDKEYEGRDEFFQAHWQRLNDLTRNPYLLSRILLRNMQAYAKENVQYLETQVGVDNMLTPEGKRLSPEATLAIFEDMLASDEAKRTGVTVRFQYAVLRFLPQAEETLKRVYAFVDKHRDRYVGVNLVGREDNDKGYPLRFLSTFRALRRQYPAVPLSIHAGEVDEPNQHVRDTLLLGADRIGHGINTITDPDTLLLMRHGPYLIEINLVSNLLLEYIDTYDQHPFPEYLRLGIPVALSTDDRGMWNSKLTDEFYLAVSRYNLSWQELTSLVENSVAYSFLSPKDKEQALTKLNQALSNFAEAQRQGSITGNAQPSGFICKFEQTVCASKAEQ